MYGFILCVLLTSPLLSVNCDLPDGTFSFKKNSWIWIRKFPILLPPGPKTVFFWAPAIKWVSKYYSINSVYSQSQVLNGYRRWPAEQQEKSECQIKFNHATWIILERINVYIVDIWIFNFTYQTSLASEKNTSYEI